jgi:hypothetical protein
MSACFHCSAPCFFHCSPLFLRRRLFSRRRKALHCNSRPISPCKSPVFFRGPLAALSGLHPCGETRRREALGTRVTRRSQASMCDRSASRPRTGSLRSPSGAGSPQAGGERTQSALPQCAAARCGVGLSSSFCTRQFRISATNSVFSLGHAISWIQPNCLSCLPDSPSTPSTLPSSESL